MDKTITRGEGNFDLKLSWTKPDCENGHPAITGYYVYSKDESGAYTRVSGKLSAEATEYEIKDLDLKGKYTYVVTTVATVDNKDYESVWSNEAHYRADEAPYIGSNGNWWVGGTDTGVKAAGDDGKPGKDGETPYIGENGNWWIGFTDTKVKAAGTDGKDGEKGEDGETPYIGENGNWWIGETDTGVKAVGTDGADGTNGTDGLTPSIGENGNWWIGTTDTGVKAAGTDGTNGTNGADGLTPSIGESIGVYNRRGNSFRHKALLVQTGDGAARSHRSAFGGGISLAIAIFKACGDTVRCYILIAPFYGAVEEKPVGHFYAFCGGVFLRPCHLIQRSVIAQSKLRFADGGSLNIRIQSAPAIMVIAVGVALVAVHPVGSGIDLLQQVAGRFVFAVGHVLVILCGKLVVGIHRKLLIHRSLRNGSLHDSFIVPCAVRFLYVIFVDEHRCTADNNTVVGLCGKALTPLLVQRTLEGLRPVQCITCFNGCLC